MDSSERMRLFDTHCHLADRAYTVDLAEVLSRARLAGVVGMLCVGYDLRSSRAAVSLAERHEDIWAAVGVHPHYAGEVVSTLPALAVGLRSLARHPKVVAIGETGLDFYRDLSPRAAQRDAFRCQVEVSLDVGLPLVVHDRDAHEETMAVLQEYYRESPGRVREAGGAGVGVMHCFSGSPALALACRNLGFLISFAGPVSFPKADENRRAAESVPLGGLLIETDCPYLAPQSRRGRRNEPAYVVEVVAALAAVHRMTAPEIAKATEANARRLFGLAAADDGMRAGGSG
jgi:TatD DNase family protein